MLFCVKLWDVETAGAAIKPLIGPTTAVIPLQNGIDSAERLIPILGAQAVMGGVAQISATIAEPGVIRQTGTFMRLIFGELEGGKSARGEAFLGAVPEGRLRRHPQRPDHDRAVDEVHPAGHQCGDDRRDPHADRACCATTPTSSPLFARASAEVAAVGRAKGIKLPDDAVEKVVGFTRSAPPAMMASMAHDLIRGNRIELPWLSGKVVALGRELGVPTPVHEILYAVLKPFVGRQGGPDR